MSLSRRGFTGHSWCVEAGNAHRGHFKRKDEGGVEAVVGQNRRVGIQAELVCPRSQREHAGSNEREHEVDDANPKHSPAARHRVCHLGSTDL